MKSRVVLLFGSLAAIVATARAEVEFAGYMRTPQGEARFVLADPVTQKTSEWIGVGGSFAGYRVTGFDAKTEMLTVEKDSAARQLRLKNAALAAAGGASSPAKDPAANAGAVRLVETAEAEILRLRTEMQKLLAEDREVLRQRAEKLGKTLPKGHPEIFQMDADIAKFTEKMERNQMERNRLLRSQLLKQIREAGSADEKARLEDGLRAVEALIAKAGVAVAPPPAAP